jgi:sugar phosphate isomerase/epimerase
MKLGIVISTQLTRFDAVAFQGRALDHLRYVAGLGYDGVELAVRDPALLDVAALEAALAQANLVVVAIGTGQAWTDEQLSFTSPDPAVRAAALRRFQSQLALAARLKAMVIVGLIRGRTPPGAARAQALAWLAEALRAGAAAAAELGVELVVEPLNRYETDLVNTVAEGLALLDQVGAGNVGLLADTFHMNIEERSLEDSLRRAGPRLRHFHAADSNRHYPGAGHLDFPRLLAALRATGYRGWVSVEVLPEPSAEAAAERALDTLRRSLPP